MKKKSLIPTSKATTAYELLSDIAKLALAEPRRMRMGMWGGLGAAQYCPPFQRPACGTVGCIGGWVNVLRPNGLTAADVLGLTGTQEATLFYDTALCSEDGQGTVTHATHVAKHIAKFQKKHAKQLKAQAV